jgi:hypothetical protein
MTRIAAMKSAALGLLRPRGTTIIDYRSDSAHAGRHRVVDAATGATIRGAFYADERRGIYRIYSRDGSGRPFFRFFDACTGEPLDHATIECQGWAGDAKVAYVRNAAGRLRAVGVYTQPAWEEVRRRIRIELIP